MGCPVHPRQSPAGEGEGSGEGKDGKHQGCRSNTQVQPGESEAESLERSQGGRGRVATSGFRDPADLLAGRGGTARPDPVL